jgi:hypothetical protein
MYEVLVNGTPVRITRTVGNPRYRELNFVPIINECPDNGGIVYCVISRLIKRHNFRCKSVDGKKNE